MSLDSTQIEFYGLPVRFRQDNTLEDEIVVSGPDDLAEAFEDWMRSVVREHESRLRVLVSGL